MRVVDIDEMKSIESDAMESFGFTEDLVLENIGLRGADFIQEEILTQRGFEEIVFLIGAKNNGADGLAVARHLCNRGYPCRAFMLFDEAESSETLKKQRELAKAFGVKFTDLNGADQLSAYFTQTQDEYLVIDAILGIGFRGPLSNYLFDIVKLVNEFSNITVSVDLATGIEANSGSIDGEAIFADYTMAVGLPKTGLYIGEGAKHTGEVAVLDCGFPLATIDGGDKALLLMENLTHIYSGRSKFAHKNSLGHALIIGGSVGLTGALIMASEAALRVGTGLVTAATWKESYEEATSRMTPEVMTGLIPTERDDVEDIIRLLERYDSIVIGPGLGRDEKTRSSVLKLLSSFAGPVSVDADAINALSLSEDADLLKSRKAATILTPHIGEFASFMGVSNAEVLSNPLGLLKEAVEKTNSCIILKGACTFLAFPTGEILINNFPNDGMATGGSGDVLSGMLGGLLAQAAPDKADKKLSGLFTNDSNYNEAMCLGVALHTLAGKHAALKNTPEAMSAKDIIKNLNEAFREISNPLL